ncbi:hypothetical protein [Kangiella sp. M94]
MKKITLLIFIFLTSGCETYEKMSKGDIVLQAKAYEQMYLKHQNLQINSSFDLYFVERTDSQGAKTKMYLIDLKNKKLAILYSNKKSIISQYERILINEPRISFTEASSLIDIKTFELDSSSCEGLDVILEQIVLPFETDIKPPYFLDGRLPEFIIQHKVDKDAVILETIETSATSLPIIRTLIELQQTVERCIGINGD